MGDTQCPSAELWKLLRNEAVRGWMQGIGAGCKVEAGLCSPVAWDPPLPALRVLLKADGRPLSD